MIRNKDHKINLEGAIVVIKDLIESNNTMMIDHLTIEWLKWEIPTHSKKLLRI